MKIILLVDFLPSGNRTAGGLQNYVLRVAQTLYALGEDVHVVCKSNVQQDQYDFPVRMIRISYKEKKILQFIQLITFHRIDTSLKLLLEAWEVQRECKNIPGVDIIQSPNYLFMGLFMKQKNAKLIVRASSYRPIWSAEVKNSFDGKLNSCLEKILFNRADHVFAPSLHLANILEENLNKQIDVLPSPVPDTEINENANWYNENLLNKKYILYFGTLLKRKGLFILAQAMKIALAKQPDILLVLAGPDLIVNKRSNHERFLELIDPYQTSTIYASSLGHAALFPVIKNSYFTVSPAIEDNCPNSMLEAMALGKVVLGTIGSSMDEFYPATCRDLLVPRENGQLLAERIMWLWDLPRDQIDQYGDECRRYVENNHNLIKSAKTLRDYYERKSSSN